MAPMDVRQLQVAALSLIRTTRMRRSPVRIMWARNIQRLLPCMLARFTVIE